MSHTVDGAPSPLDSIRKMIIEKIDPVPMKSFWEIYDKHYDDMNRELLEVCRQVPELNDLLQAIPEKQRAESEEKSRGIMRETLVNGHWEGMLRNLMEQGETYAQMNLSFSSWFILTTAFRKVITPRIFQDLASDVGMIARVVDAVDVYLDITISVIGEQYLKVKEMVISKQEQEILELSTPVLKLQDHLLLLPIVGVLDTQRARQLTVQLLNMIREHRAKAIVIDITGVPAVDSKVAQHLIQTIAAAKLMGALSVVTGLSPTIASTLVALGIDLSVVQTVGDLQGGIEEAERLLKIRELGRLQAL